MELTLATIKKDSHFLIKPINDFTEAKAPRNKREWIWRGMGNNVKTVVVSQVELP
ncbi:MAG: hypothetical protein WKF36_06770 [Candidatus Nitrosocosmicus sp.]